MLSAWFDNEFRQLAIQHRENDEVDFMHFLHSFPSVVRAWNKSSFGDIFRQKKNCLSRLAGIQSAFEQGPSDFLVQLEHELTLEYSQILV